MAEVTSAPPQDARCVTGDLKNFNIFDITQSLMMSRKTALVTVQNGVKRGYVYFKDGQIWSALDDDLTIGEPAAFKIFYWRGGTFRIDFDAPPRERNIKLDTENLMLEIARHMDESKRRDDIEGKQGPTSTEVQGKFEDRFRSELNKVFSQVAQQTTPTRDRYTVRAFDALLIALNDLQGSALFLRPEMRPRVKTSHGFETIKQETVSASEIEGFLNALLSQREREILHDQKEIAVYHSTPQAGVYRVSAFYDGGRPSCIFTPASRNVPMLAKIGGDVEAAAALMTKPSGLVLVVGAMPSGKSIVLAALLEETLRRRECLATHFARHHMYAFTDEFGFLIRADVTRFTLEKDGSLAEAVQQECDVIAVDEIADAEMLRNAVNVASGACLVVGTFEADDPADAAERLQRLAAATGSERVARQLGQCLSAVVLVDMRAPAGAKQVEVRSIPDAVRPAIARNEPGAFSFLKSPAR